MSIMRLVLVEPKVMIGFRCACRTMGKYVSVQHTLHTYNVIHYMFVIIKNNQEYDGQDTPWYQSNGERSIVKHQCNLRSNVGQRKLYESVKMRGLGHQVRGNPWLVSPEVGSFPLMAIAWASLIAAVYEFIEAEPGHPIAIKLKAEGVKRSVVFCFKRPMTVLVWLEGYHNEFHDGHKPSVFDWLEDTCV